MAYDLVSRACRFSIVWRQLFSDLDLELLLGHIDHLIVEICTQSGLLEFLLKPPDLLFQRLGRHSLAASLRSMDAGHSLGGNLLLHR